MVEAGTTPVGYADSPLPAEAEPEHKKAAPVWHNRNTLDKLGAAYPLHNIEEEEGAADRAVAISGQMHIPVVRYDDGSFQVEPSAVDIKNKLQELGLLAD